MPARPYLPFALSNYTPVLKAMPVPPINGLMQPPLVCVTFSAALVPYLLGLLELYRWPDKLSGTEEEVNTALGIFQDLMAVLMEGNCVEMAITDLRIDGCSLEVQYNGVQTWIPVGDLTSCSVPGPQGPQGEPGTPATPTPPAPDPNISGVKCNVAMGVADWLNSKFSDYLNQISANLQNEVSHERGIELVISAIPVAGALINYLIDSYNGAVAQGIAITQAQFDTQFKENVACYLYCLLGNDGVISQSIFDAWMQQIIDHEVSEIDNIYTKFAKSILLVEYQRRAKIYEGVEGNCAPCACEWCYEWDFTVSDGGWVENPTLGEGRAVYETGVGWASQGGSGGRVLDIQKSIPDGTTITELDFWWHTDVAPENIHGNPYYDNQSGWIYNGTNTSGQWVRTGQATANLLGLLSGNGTGSGVGNGAHYWVTKARVFGVGTNPFGTSNCV